MRTGVNNPNWRGGRSLTPDGYVLIRVGKKHHLADVRGYAYEHRMVAETLLGRPLEDGEMVRHHEPPWDNNAPDNLIVCSDRAHFMFYNRTNDTRQLRLPGEDNPLVSCECGCGSAFTKYDGFGRPRRYVSGHNTASRP